jgi:hypothetical protein
MDSSSRARRSTASASPGKRMIRIAAIVSLVAACAATASAQTTVRVTGEPSTIWKADFATAAAVVHAGTVLTVVSRRDEFFEVVVPGSGTSGERVTGFIFASNVESTGGRRGAAPAPPYAFGPEPPAFTHRTFGLFAFGQGAYMQFAARNSFAAVLDHSGGAFFGGGAELRFWSRVFVNGSVEYFSKRGQRVFVIDGDVFRLGTPETITIMPITVTAGWRFEHEHITPYLGAGSGRTTYKETSNGADPGENVDSRFTSYHALGGVEIRDQWIATAFEVVYTRVPDGLGRGGASAAFGESNLGGVSGRIKVIVGR